MAKNETITVITPGGSKTFGPMSSSDADKVEEVAVITGAITSRKPAR